MSLDRPDVKARLDPEYHRALKRICDARGVTISEFTEELLVREVRRIVHEASVIAESAPDLGIAGKNREKPGMSGRDRDQEENR